MIGYNYNLFSYNHLDYNIVLDNHIAYYIDLVLDFVLVLVLFLGSIPDIYNKCYFLIFSLISGIIVRVALIILYNGYYNIFTFRVLSLIWLF